MRVQDTMSRRELVERFLRNVRDGVRIFAINVALRFIRRIDYPERTLCVTVVWDSDEPGEMQSITEFINEEWKYLTEYHIKELW